MPKTTANELVYEYKLLADGAFFAKRNLWLGSQKARKDQTYSIDKSIIIEYGCPFTLEVKLYYNYTASGVKTLSVKCEKLTRDLAYINTADFPSEDEIPSDFFLETVKEIFGEYVLVRVTSVKEESWQPFQARYKVRATRGGDQAGYVQRIAIVTRDMQDFPLRQPDQSRICLMACLFYGE